MSSPDSMVYEVAVVGAGVMGSWTAHTLAERGIKTVLLEQFAVGHTRGSSHGRSRVTRKAYSQSYIVDMMAEAYQSWEKMEQRTGTKLYIPTGILVFGEKGADNDLKPVASALRKNGIPFETFSGEEANSRYPGLRLPRDFGCILDKDGGILLSDRALAAVQNSFKELGGTLLENHEVVSVEPGPVITLTTSGGRKVLSRKVILTTGGWGKRLLGQLDLTVPLQPIRTEVLYWKVNDPNLFSSSNFPTFWYSPPSNPSHSLIYGIPCHEYPGLIKISIGHYGNFLHTPDDAVLAENRTPFTVEHVSQFVAQYFIGVCPTPSSFEVCIYTDTPDLLPILDRHPEHPNIVFGLGFSGHGFKLSPVVGKLLCELAMDYPPSHDLSPFRLSRFKTKEKSHL